MANCIATAKAKRAEPAEANRVRPAVAHSKAPVVANRIRPTVDHRKAPVVANRVRPAVANCKVPAVVAFDYTAQALVGPQQIPRPTATKTCSVPVRQPASNLYRTTIAVLTGY